MYLISTLTTKTLNFVCVKRHQNNRETPRIRAHRDYTPGSEIPGSATANLLIINQIYNDNHLTITPPLFKSYFIYVCLKTACIETGLVGVLLF